MSTQPNVLCQWCLLKCLTSRRKYHHYTLWKNTCTHGLDTRHWRQKTDTNFIQNNGDVTVWTMCSFLSYLEQSLAIHHPVKVLHNGRGPQKIKQERNFAKEKGDLIHTSSCDWRRSEGLYNYGPMHRRSSVAQKTSSFQLKVHCFLTRSQLNKLLQM